MRYSIEVLTKELLKLRRIVPKSFKRKYIVESRIDEIERAISILKYFK